MCHCKSILFCMENDLIFEIIENLNFALGRYVSNVGEI